MPTTTELDPFAAAVEAAKGETVGEPAVEPAEDPTQDPGTEPEGVDDQAASEVDEQPHVEGPPTEESAEEADPADEVDEVFADVEIDEPAPAEPQEQVFQLPGIDEPVPLQEVLDGYLRQSDYTRKTQEVAAMRKDHERAISFWEAFTQHPKQVVLQLAKEAGLEVGDVTVEKMVDMPFTSEEDLQAMIDAEVEKRLAVDPRIQAAQEQETLRWIEGEFSKIESDLEISLGPESRKKVLSRALAAGTDDLGMVTRAMLAELEAKQARTQALRQASPKRPTGAPSEVIDEDTPLAEDPFDNAVEHAKLEINKRGRR